MYLQRKTKMANKKLQQESKYEKYDLDGDGIVTDAEFEMDQKLIRLEKIAISNKSRALIMVHYFGVPQNIVKFINFCLKHNLYLIEDNAHGYGNKINKDKELKNQFIEKFRNN